MGYQHGLIEQLPSLQIPGDIQPLQEAEEEQEQLFNVKGVFEEKPCGMLFNLYRGSHMTIEYAAREGALFKTKSFFGGEAMTCCSPCRRAGRVQHQRRGVWQSPLTLSSSKRGATPKKGRVAEPPHLVIEEDRCNTEEGESGRAREGRPRARQRSDHGRASLCLPPRVHYRAAALTHHLRACAALK